MGADKQFKKGDNTMEFRLIIGIGQDKNGIELDPGHVQTALALIGRDLSRAFGGYTQTMGVGGWINSADKCVTEPCAIFTVATDTTWIYDPDSRKPGTLSFIVARAKQMLRQECIMVSVIDSKNYFV